MSRRENDEYTQLMYRAYLRDGHTEHSGEALLLACLLHAKGKSRESADMIEVQRLMRDRNLDK